MTAVEWLHEKLATSQLEDMQTNINLWFLQAKQMEKKQGYTEDEVLEIIRQYALEEHLITSSKPDEWFKQFKTKQQ